ncbi:MAG TPA: hypothetical protein VGC45_16550 [Gryllotalpicola sp.]
MADFVLIGVNLLARRIVLAITAALGLSVGLWAALFPRVFFTSFPGFGLHWIDESGAFDEHLIRDVGGLYLALVAITIAAFFTRALIAARLAGLGWTVFNVIHFAFHVTHLPPALVDVVGNMVSLGLSLILGVLLLLPERTTSNSKGNQ